MPHSELQHIIVYRDVAAPFLRHVEGLVCMVQKLSLNFAKYLLRCCTDNPVNYPYRINMLPSMWQRPGKRHGQAEANGDSESWSYPLRYHEGHIVAGHRQYDGEFLSSVTGHQVNAPHLLLHLEGYFLQNHIAVWWPYVSLTFLK